MSETHTSGRPASVDPLELISLLRPSIVAAVAESEIRGDIPATLPNRLFTPAGSGPVASYRLLTSG